MRKPASPIAAALALVAAAIGCQEPAAPEAIPIGLLLSYSGSLAATSINSERALQMAIEAANRAGGVGGRPVALVARDTASDASKVTPVARELVEAGARLFVGPDTPEVAVELKVLLGDHTVILPSFTTASNFSKPHSWFVMGPPAARMACELQAQLQADGRQKPLVVADPNGYNSQLAFELTLTYSMPWVFLPSQEPSNDRTVQPIVAAKADAYVLAALPASASSLVYALAAVGALEPSRLYLSPTLHTPALLQTVPQGMLEGAHGVAAGNMEGSEIFRARFGARWQDAPLDDAVTFYDAGVMAVLALQRALTQTGAISAGAELAAHLVAVTRTGGTQVPWDDVARGLELLREGQEIEYVGLSEPLEFDLTGQTPTTTAHWWTVGPGGFVPRPSPSLCK
jgi:branched-chain amino acid transport system substrate-binding protein